MVDFVEGPLSEIALDTNAKQAVFIAAEAQDVNSASDTTVQQAVQAAVTATEQATLAGGYAVAAGTSADLALAAQLDIQTNWGDKLVAADVSADAAAASAADAGAAQVAAAAARDSTFFNSGRTFISVSAGLAGSTDGQQFAVIEGQWVQIYTRTNSTTAAVVTGAKYPTADNDSFKATEFSEPVGKQLGGFVDESGFYRWVLLEDGSFGTDEAAVKPNGLDTEVGAIVFNEDGFIELTDAFGFVGSKPVAQYMPAAEQKEDGKILEFADPYGYSAFVTGDTFAASKDAAPAQVKQRRFYTPGPGVTFAAHRGAHLFGNAAPENSLDAFVLAARAGFTHVETDLQKTSDGHFVMLHDTTLDRTCRNASDYSAVTGGVAVASLTLAQLRANYVLASNTVRYRKPVPTLGEFLQLCKPWALYPIAEIKFTGGTDSELAALFTKFNAALGPGKFTIADFNSVELDYIRTLSASANLQYLGVVGATTQAEIFSHVATKQPAAVSLTWPSVTSDTVALARASGVDLHVWTVPAADINTVLEFAQSLVVTDQIPPNNYQATVVHSALGMSAVTTTGTTANDVVTLTSGQTINFIGGEKLAFGAYYCRFWLKGEATVIGASSFSAGATIFQKFISSTDGRYFDFRSLLANDSPNVRIIAGAGGCQVSDPSITVTTFQ